MKQFRKTVLFFVLALVMTLAVPEFPGVSRNASAEETTPDTEAAAVTKKKKVRKRGWVKKGSRIYYYYPSGAMAVGRRKIKGKVYFFTRKGKKRGVMKTGLVRIKGKEYFFRKKGKPGVIGSGVNGWFNIKGRGMCNCVNGRIRKEYCIDDYYLNSSGAMTTTSRALYKLVKQTVKQHVRNGMTKEKKLRCCYDYLCSSAFTYVTKRPFSYASTWRLTYGYEMFTTHSGVCYNFAAALAYMARYIGYTDVKAIAGELLYLDGHWDLHSWTKIRMDGYDYVFDSSMEHGGMGDFWKKTYAGTGRKYREWNNL